MDRRVLEGVRVLDQQVDADAVLRRARDVLGELGSLSLDGLHDVALTESVMRTQELRGALEAAEARLLGEWDRRRVWRADGAKSGAAWLASRQHLPVAETRRRLRHARAVRRFPAIGHDWARGAIDRCHIATDHPGGLSLIHI